MSTTAPEQPAEGQDPQAPPAAPAAPAAPPAPPAPPAPAGAAPWANDLNALFTDETTRGQVDQFLREKVQPYSTKLEQQVAQNQDAARLYNDLNQNPVDTYVAITTELFGEAAGQQVLAQIQQQLSQQEQPQLGESAPASDPRMEQALAWIESQQTNQYYNNEIERIANDPQFTDIDTNLLHPFVAAADGNFDQAVELYRQADAQFRARYTASQEPPPPEAPQVLGSDTATSTAPPTVPQHQSLNEAIEDFVRESRTNSAPPVGPA